MQRGHSLEEVDEFMQGDKRTKAKGDRWLGSSETGQRALHRFHRLTGSKADPIQKSQVSRVEVCGRGR